MLKKDEEMDEEEPNPEEGDDEEDSEETVGDVLDTLTDKQRSVVYALLAEAKVSPPEEPDEEDEEEVAPEDPEEEKIEHTNKGETLMKKNVFDREPDVKKEKHPQPLRHAGGHLRRKAFWYHERKCSFTRNHRY